MEKIGKYWPLLALIIVSALVACALPTSGFGHGMHYFMGFFFCVFALLKIFDLSGFANGFQKYDLLAKISRPYALLYPFLELGLGLAYFSLYAPAMTYVVTVILMGFGAIGVFTALKGGLKMNCPCMGNVLKVPLSTVTLTEDIGMGGMAAIMLIMAL